MPVSRPLHFWRTPGIGGYADRDRAKAGGRRPEADGFVLVQPALGYAAAEHQALAFFAHEAVADHQYSFGGCPDVVTVAHAASQGANRTGIGPPTVAVFVVALGKKFERFF